jgi:GNAT superfamily N-acetyltransferase
MIEVRDAEASDVPALTTIKGVGSSAIHRDRLRAVQDASFRYLVLLADQEIIGFACLVMRRPEYWSDSGDTRHLPQIVDLKVKESHRGQGYGSEFIRAIEQIAAATGHGQIYISVEPLNNPRAYAIYQRLGYQQLQPEPYRKIWEFKDSDGRLHRGEDWVVDMVKQLKGWT